MVINLLLTLNYKYLFYLNPSMALLGIRIHVYRVMCTNELRL